MVACWSMARNSAGPNGVLNFRPRRAATNFSLSVLLALRMASKIACMVA
ncbi:MAG: hypothetical protein BWX79_00886 [Alphaproteobacteria bacterium ADurb.Bin100]|nr:MAG: hypothetical protein BWX79_00886 [Alphaproteobacteria bacterium ADurb.Bin100]